MESSRMARARTRTSRYCPVRSERDYDLNQNEGAFNARSEIENLKIGQASQAATMAGAQATQMAAQAGTWSTMEAGFVGFIAGIFLGMAIARSRHD
jgi:hypothetical protein